MRRYRRTRKDANHTEIVHALERAGYTVEDLSAVGGGCPDLLVGAAGRNVLLEIKNPKRKGGKNNNANTLERQKAWRTCWNGEVHVVETVDQALNVMRTRPGVRGDTFAQDYRSAA